MEKPLKLICNWHVTYMSLLRARCAILSLSKTHIGNQTGGNGWGVRISHGTEKKGLPAVERMRTYEAGPVDVLITEGTMLSRLGETKDVLVKSELERDGIGCHDLL